MYPHEIAISHVRRLLDQDFACVKVGETDVQFRKRMDAMCEHMNSAAFPAKDGRGLEGLCKSWGARCQDVIDRDGGRIPR